MYVHQCIIVHYLEALNVQRLVAQRSSWEGGLSLALLELEVGLGLRLTVVSRLMSGRLAVTD